MSGPEVDAVRIAIGPGGRLEARLAVPITLALASGEMISLGWDTVFTFEDGRRDKPPSFDLTLIASADDRLIGLSIRADFEGDRRGVAAIRAESANHLIARMLAGPPTLAELIEAHLSPEGALEAISEALFATDEWAAALGYLCDEPSGALEQWARDGRIPRRVWAGLAKALESRADEIKMLATRARAFADRAK